MSKKNILFLIDELDEWRGTETHLYRLLKNINTDTIHAHIAIIGASRISEDFLDINVPVEVLNIYNIFSLKGIVGFFRLCKLIIHNDIDIVVSYHTASDLLAPIACAFLRKKCISCRRDDGFTKKSIHKKIQRYLNYLVDGMISVSDAVKLAVNRDEFFQLNKNTVIWNGEDLLNFSPIGKNSRTSFSFSEQDFVLISVGGLVEVKNHKVLIQSVLNLLPDNPSMHLILVGQGHLLPDYKKMIHGFESNIHLLGYRSDISDLLRTADIYIQPSLTEGFSNAIVQAMACSLPVIASDVGGNTELVTDKCGYLISPHDTDKLSSYILNLKNKPDLRKQFGENARKLVTERCSIKHMCNQYEDYFSSL
ncbi:MAG: glycosyltransferase [Methylococcales bacterium]